MDLKKIRLFGYFVLISSLIIIFLALFKIVFENNIIPNLGKTGPELYNIIKRLNIVVAVLLVISVILLIISYVTLMIQAARVDDASESHFFIFVAMFSIVPLCSLTLIIRASHLLYLERTKKAQELIEKLENIQEQEEQELLMEQEIPNENIEGLIEKPQIEDIIPSDYYVVEEKKKKSKKKIEKVVLEERFDINDIDNSINDYNNDNIQESNTSNDDLVTYNSENNEVLFNRKKYLSLKGTKYSLNKTSGKKKIPSELYKKLEELVDNLENATITYDEFYLEKEKLLS